MKKSLVLFTVCFTLLHFQTKAQIFKHLEDKAEQKADEKVDDLFVKHKHTSNTSTTDVSVFTEAAKVYDFKPGTQNIFWDNFETDSLGNMPHNWKTSGSGSVQTFPNQLGKWFLLNEYTSYKLRKDASLPENFTIEFDIATHSNTSADDLESLIFGFAHDNNISSYIGDAYNNNAITATQIHYWNKEIINSSSDTKIYNSQKFPLQQYAVGKMHVAISVNGSSMKVYLDKVKVLDADMFLNTSMNKHFYISTATRIDNGAQIAIGNFKINAL
jgi:hypothetical protein